MKVFSESLIPYESLIGKCHRKVSQESLIGSLFGKSHRKVLYRNIYESLFGKSYTIRKSYMKVS